MEPMMWQVIDVFSGEEIATYKFEKLALNRVVRMNREVGFHRYTYRRG